MQLVVVGQRKCFPLPSLPFSILYDYPLARPRHVIRLPDLVLFYPGASFLVGTHVRGTVAKTRFFVSPSDSLLPCYTYELLHLD